MKILWITGVILVAMFVALAGYVHWTYLTLVRSPDEPALPEGEWIEIDGEKIYLTRQGRGEPLVLLHGIGASIYSWRLLLPRLSRHFDVIALDLLGFGRSSKPKTFLSLDEQMRILLATLDRLGLEQAHFVGSSMGATLALWLGLNQPHRLKKIVAIAPAVDPKILPIPLTGLRPLSPLFVGLINRWTMVFILRRIYSQRGRVHAPAVHTYLRPYRWSPSAIGAFLSATQALRDKRLPQALKDLIIPTLLLHGEKDLIVSSQHTKALGKIIGNSLYREIPAAGHHPQEDQPERVAEEILHFLSPAKALTKASSQILPSS